MTTETALKQRLAILYRTLADATVECPKCDALCEEMRKSPDASQGRPTGIPCRCVAFSDGCNGTGRVARFPGFRQECKESWHAQFSSPSCSCNGRRWRVRAGDSADGLAQLSPKQMKDWLFLFMTWLEECWKADYITPSALEIRAKELELVIEVAGKEVPDVAD